MTEVDEKTWKWCAPLLQSALDRAGNTHSLADVRADIEANRAQLWLGEDSVAVTEVYDYPNKKAVHVWLMAGNLDEILRFDGQLLEFARRAGAACIQLDGRPGWTRRLRKFGYRHLTTRLVREVL